MWDSMWPSRVAATLSVAVLISGCSNVVLYDEKRDAQAQATKKAVAEAKIAEVIGGLEKSFAEVAALEEAQARERAAAQFDEQLSLAALAPTLATITKRIETPSATPGGLPRTKTVPNGLTTIVTSRLGKLGVPKSARDETTADSLGRTARTFVEQRKIIEAAGYALERHQIEFHGITGHRFADCAEIEAAMVLPPSAAEAASTPASPSDAVPLSSFIARLPAASRTHAVTQFPELVRQCRKIADARAKRRSLFSDKDESERKLNEEPTRSSEVAKLERQLLALRNGIRKYELDMSQTRQAIDAAMAATPKSEGSSTHLKTVEQRAEDLKQVLGKLPQSAAVAQVLSEERTRRLQSILATIAGTPSGGTGVALSEDDKIATEIIRGIPELVDEADKLYKQARKPRQVPFAAAIEQQKLVLQRLQAGLAAMRKEADAVDAQLQAMMNEAYTLSEVHLALNRNAAWSTQPLSTVIVKASAVERPALLRGLAMYADEVKLYRIEGEAWQSRVLAAQYGRNLAQAKYVAAQWDALNETIATVLADYHASGIKKAELAEFFKALGLVVIGVGVAQ